MKWGIPLPRSYRRGGSTLGIVVVFAFTPVVPGDNGAGFAVVPTSSSGRSGNGVSCVVRNENENNVPGYGGSLVGGAASVAVSLKRTPVSLSSPLENNCLLRLLRRIVVGLCVSWIRRQYGRELVGPCRRRVGLVRMKGEQKE